ncbi:Predicted oxidoreductase [Tranquillimonas rosea]|uniref:Predicted oxidoreductase n=1 Tax=Tranquillimonas rosea TaxID=641238 RepID=A0A1H9V2K7_9RHOB|nr:aldo/keto reductase [Tranquillimonas rosea]SES15799.1 Predicted oxidoreductase [Tranquillimonas rosea]
MDSRKLGANGPDVSAIGLGAMNICGFYGPSSEDEARALFRRAAELGVTHLDTSNVYGNGFSEEVIGRYLAAGEPGFTLATKAGIRRDPDSGARFYDNSPAHLREALETSLERLGVDRVELFYIHRREADRPIEEVAETLADFRKEGLIGGFGFSEIAPASLRRAAAVHPVAAVQSEYSLSTRAPELGLVQACEELGTALVAFSPVGRGLLTDVPPTPEIVEDSVFLKVNPRFLPPNLAANVAITDGFRALAAEMGCPAASLAIAWLLARSPAVIPIPGTRGVVHLEELVRGAGMRLSAEDMARIEAVLPVGWAHGDRYSDAQWHGPERFC